MLELRVDGDFVTQTKLFSSDQKVQLIIDGQENKKIEIETGILQGSPVLSILFLIYISGVISDALDIAAKKTLNIKNAPETIFCDSQKALRVIKHPPRTKKNQFLQGFICKKNKRLKSNGHHVTIQWIPSYLGFFGNYKANQTAKNKAEM